jgi:hypothetical protein
VLLQGFLIEVASDERANRDPSEQFAAHSCRFPVLSRKFAVPRKKFAVSSHREFASKALIGLDKAAQKSVLGIDFRGIPC